MQPGGRLDLTVVVPYYNPGPNLAGHVAEVIAVLRDHGVSFESSRFLTARLTE